MPRQLPPVDDDVFEALQARAEPLVDDINSVLRRLLDLPTPHQAAPAVTPLTEEAPRSQPLQPDRSHGTSLQDRDYELPVLAALQQLGGRAPAARVIDQVGAILENKFSAKDRDRLRSGEVRWRNRTQFARLRLVHAGDMADNSPRGIWEITNQGRQRLGG